MRRRCQFYAGDLPRADQLSSLFAKNFSLPFEAKSPAYSTHPVPHEGRFAIVTDVRRDAVDADAPLTNGAEADGEVVWS
jgi:hypothetical protein